MNLKGYNLLILGIVSILLFNCNVLKNKSTRKIETIYNYCKYAEIDTTFRLRVIDYTSGVGCGLHIPSASNCLGVNSIGDTVRVLSLCSTDTSFSINDVLTVIPKRKPDFFVSIQVSYYKDFNNELKIIRLQRHKYKTIYGDLIKIPNTP